MKFSTLLLPALAALAAASPVQSDSIAPRNADVLWPGYIDISKEACRLTADGSNTNAAGDCDSMVDFTVSFCKLAAERFGLGFTAERCDALRGGYRIMVPGTVVVPTLRCSLWGMPVPCEAYPRNTPGLVVFRGF